MSLVETEAIEFWSGTTNCIEWSYFEDGFDKAKDIVGNCFICEWYGDSQACPVDHELLKEMAHSFYCASFDEKPTGKQDTLGNIKL